MSIPYWQELVGYRERANRYRPTDQQRLSEEVRHLAAQGLTPRDISAVMGIGVGAVRQLLESPQV